jgi:serine/threonine protein kinase
MDEEAIFITALEMASADRRAAYLDQACAGNAGLRRQVEELLAAHGQAGDYLDNAAAAWNAYLPIGDQQAKAEQPGTVIGPYKLLEQIGEGGMGLVFMAEQSRPVRRRVALKVIKPGMDTRHVVARFEAERQALALMDHPNIAHAFDAGTTDSGRPYFVMELVRGVPITEFCDQRRLTTRQRLELFVTVCQAVQHAHQKGIIHRDLKPSNVLVTLHDVIAVPKIIDFGIAKATTQRLTERTLFTNFAQMVGTPLYMSPEQAEMNGLDVDTRSDVYALGVLLYELLTGTTPFESQTLKKVGLDEMRRMIREEEPPTPSQRLHTLDAQVCSTVSEQRSVDSRRLGQVLRGELDWIVMKALEKDRDRRYESASAFAADVQRYLNDEAVAACPPSARYRLRKYVRRNRRVLAMVGVVAASLITATAVSIWQAARATEAQHQAEADRKQAEADRDRAEAAEGRATTESAIARAVNNFLQEDLLKQANSAEDGPASNGDPNLTVREALRRASAKVGDGFRDQPLVEAAIRTAIAEACSLVREFRLATEHLERAMALRKAQLGPHHQETSHHMRILANAYAWSGRGPEAVVIFEQLLEDAKSRLGPDDPELLDQMVELAKTYRLVGEWKKAIRLLEQLIEKDATRRGPIEVGASGIALTLALTYSAAGRPAEGAALIDKVRECVHKTSGAYPKPTDFFEHCRGYAYQRAGRLDEADQVLRAVVDQLRLQGARSVSLAMNLELLSVNLLLQHRYSEVEQPAREAIALYEKNEKNLTDESDWRFPYIKNVLGGSLLAQNRYAEAEPLLVQGYEGMKRAENAMTANWRYRLPEAGERVIRYYEETKQPEKARQWRQKLLKDESKK